MERDLSLRIYDPKADKVRKSIPKRGADNKKYNIAKSDFEILKKMNKWVVKIRTYLFIKAYLSGLEFDVNGWKTTYFENVLLNYFVELIVWEQSKKTFILKDKKPIDSNGDRFDITNAPIRIAHPMEMEKTDVIAWQKYFTANGLEQPFAQIWEPVIDPKQIKTDRYKGILIPYNKLKEMHEHGIHDIPHYHYPSGIPFDDIYASIKRDYSNSKASLLEIRSIKLTKYSRKSNHIIAYLDRITVYEKVLKDDASIVDQLRFFTLAQISEFIKVALENNCTNVTAVLLEYKNKNFEEFNPMDEFILDL